MKTNKYYCFIVGLFGLTVLTSCQIFSKNIQTITLPPKAQQPVAALLSNTSTRCIGTYLIDGSATLIHTTFLRGKENLSQLKKE
ncbi:hypothetical protein, partial [Gilliamella bombi]|uniref:hypothetical protein n=1 Tax=Gilliamella bombi TaxID=1908521 RepID=UPI00117AA146